MSNNKRPVFFGCDFDPNPDIDGIRRKILRFLEKSGHINQESPYDIFINNLNKASVLSSSCRFGGKYPCPGWLSALPDFSVELYPEMFRSFINEGGCLEYAEGFGNYVASELKAGEIPVSIGVDHCLTGGIIKALSKQYGDLMVIVFDRHLDAIPPYIRNDMVGYMREQSEKGGGASLSYEYYEGTFTGNYDTGSFLNYLLKEGTLQGRNLMVFGTQDCPSPELRGIRDERIARYLKEYEWLENQGVVIKSLYTLNRAAGRDDMQDILKKAAGRNVYLSIDIDVLKGKIGSAARYGGDGGLATARLLKLLDWLELGNSNLAGIDVMELDVNSLSSARLKEYDVYSFMKNFIDEIFKKAGVL
jgi:arginase family enzyme